MILSTKPVFLLSYMKSIALGTVENLELCAN